MITDLPSCEERLHDALVKIVAQDANVVCCLRLLGLRRQTVLFNLGIELLHGALLVVRALAATIERVFHFNYYKHINRNFSGLDRARLCNA